MKDSRMRSVIKALSWRVIATGDVKVMAHVGIVDVLVKLFFYYAHERAWGRVSWNRAVLKA